MKNKIFREVEPSVLIPLFLKERIRKALGIPKHAKAEDKRIAINNFIRGATFEKLLQFERHNANFEARNSTEIAKKTAPEEKGNHLSPTFSYRPMKARSKVSEDSEPPDRYDIDGRD
jgi:hypothetical protein